MSSGARQQLRELQKSLYEKAFAEAKAKSVFGSPTILNYSENYADSLPKKFQRSNLKTLMAALHKRTFVLFGDFHTLKQSQRGLLRLLKAYMYNYKKPIVLALEMFKAEDQKFIDQYIDGEITDRKLLEVTNYAKNWGFPWAHYKMILDFAIESQIPVVGINTEQAGKDSLEKRDEFAADILTGLAEKYSDHMILCLIGEYHLADQHLPHYLARKAEERDLDSRVFRIFTNVDEYYFKTQHPHSAPTSEYLYLKEDAYCIQNSPPWIKWQSYAIWEEMRSIELYTAYDADEDDELQGIYTEDVFDIDSQVLELMNHVVAFLKLPTHERDLTRFNVYFSPEDDTFEGFQQQFAMSGKDVDIAIERTSLDGYYFLAQGNAMIVTDLSLNNLANLSGQFLRHLLEGRAMPQFSDEEAFYDRILTSAAGMVASKILNPRRKGPDIWNFRKLLKLNRGKRLVGHAQVKREAAKAVIRFHEWVSRKLLKKNAKLTRPPTSVFNYDKFSYHEVSKALGDILGYTLYARIMSYTAPPELMRQLFMPMRTKLPSEVFSEIYFTIMH